MSTADDASKWERVKTFYITWICSRLIEKHLDNKLIISIKNVLQFNTRRILMQSIKDAAHDFQTWLKGSRCSSVHIINMCKQTGCKYFEQEGQMSLYFEQEGQMSLYFKQEGQDVPIFSHLATIVYNKRLSRAERINFDVGIRRFICSIYVIFSMWKSILLPV